MITTINRIAMITTINIIAMITIINIIAIITTPGLCYKIPVFSDPAPGKS